MLLPSSISYYGEIPTISAINAISYLEGVDHIQSIQPWADLRNIFEYMACVEHACNELFTLPKGNAIGSKDIASARYNSAAMVFFAQAALDNLAVWLNDAFELKLTGTNISFYKNKIKPMLQQKNDKFRVSIENNENFIGNLNDFRMEWLHRMAGGAELYSDKAPSDPTAKIEIKVPINPKIPSLRSKPKAYLALIESTEKANNGQWTMPIDEFATYIKGATLEFLISILDVALESKDQVRAHP